MLKVLVIGESCTDRFIYCETSRFSPEAPVPVLTPLEIIENDGMSGNVVRNIIALRKDILINHWYQDEKIVKTRFVEKKSNHMFIRFDEGEKNITNINLTEQQLSDIKTYDIVIVSDYDKGFINDEHLIKIGSLSKLSILDSKRKLKKDIIDCYSFVKLNENEYKNNQEIELCDKALVTLGSKGTMFNDTIYPSPNPQETIDVSGAGDTFTASFILKYFESKNVIESINFANEKSAIVVSKRGVSVP